MHMLFQKTFLRINVATIEVRVDKPAQTQLASLAQGQKYSDGLAQQLAGVAIGAQRAVVQMTFKRDVGLNRWIDVVRENLEQARKAGLISPDLERRVGQGLPQWFSPLKERGYLIELKYTARTGRIVKNRDTGKFGNGFSEQLQPLPAELSGPRAERPVTLPPGRARLSTRPASTGSESTARHNDGNRLGRIHGRPDPRGPPPATTTMSTLRRTSSAASSGYRSCFPSAYRFQNFLFMCPPQSKIGNGST